ncbi:hypothetical protein CPB84DRAFT_1644167, partial [Gymnopilus junonius]
CEAKCRRWFTSIGSMNSHLSTSRSCAWYAKGKLRDLGLDDDDDTNPLPPPPPPELEDDNWRDYDPQQDPDIDMEFGPYEDEYDFLPPVAGPGPQTAENQILHGAANTRASALDMDDDKLFIQIDETAGRIYRRDPPPRHLQVDKDGDNLMDNDGEPNPFFPFTSELDWRVAQWAVKDGPGHNAFNRLLDIPGVIEKLGLSYHNIRGLHQKLDSIPEKAGNWKSVKLSFDSNERPNESFTLRYHDPIEAVRSLWKDPQLSPEMVFAGQKVFSDKTLNNRIFTEMNMGKWWHILQVSVP